MFFRVAVCIVFIVLYAKTLRYRFKFVEPYAVDSSRSAVNV